MAESFFTNPTINKEDIVVNEQILEKDKDKTTTEIITNKLPLPVQEGIELVGDIKEEGFVKTEPDEEVVESQKKLSLPILPKKTQQSQTGNESNMALINKLGYSKTYGELAKQKFQMF